MESLFIYPDDGYQRDINPVANYIRLTSHYIATITGDDVESVIEWVKKKIISKDPNFIPTKEPTIAFLSKDQSSDRQKVESSLSDYIQYIVRTDRLLAPTGTVYKQPDEELSMFTPFINNGRNERSVEKKLMHLSKLDNRLEDADAHNENQGNIKIDNNSLSGGALSPSTILHTQSTHPSLTSTGRIATSIANVINEKLITNNRHYNTPNVTLDNLIVLSYMADTKMIRECVEMYDLVVPSTDQVMAMVYESTRNYWRDKKWTEKIRQFVDACTPEARCNMYYHSTLWGILDLNPGFGYYLIDDLSEPSDELLDIQEAEKTVKGAYGDLKTFAVYLCFEYTSGKSLDACLKTAPDVYSRVAATVKLIEKNLIKYQFLFLTFFKLSFLPGNLFDIKSFYRKCVVTSDTDSTNFSTQDICKFITGKYGITAKDKKVNFLVTYLSSMIVCQTLGLLSANMGVRKEYIRELSMKNEYYIAIHLLTPSAKNYIMLLVGQEGSILPEVELTIKGVELRSSKIPKVLMDKFVEYVKEALNKIYNGGYLTLEELLMPPYANEKIILESLKRGETTYLMNEYIKHPDAYSDEEEARQWQYHMFYEEVFAPKYGHSTDIPYTAYIVSVDLGGKKKIKEWLESIEDEALRERATKYVGANPKALNALAFPVQLFVGKEVPVEIRHVISYRAMTMRIMSNWYLLLEAYGIYLKNKYNSKMLTTTFKDYVEEGMAVEDFYTKDEEDV